MGNLSAIYLKKDSKKDLYQLLGFNKMEIDHGRLILLMHRFVEQLTLMLENMAIQ